MHLPLQEAPGRRPARDCGASQRGDVPQRRQGPRLPSEQRVRFTPCNLGSPESNPHVTESRPPDKETAGEDRKPSRL